MPDPIDQFPWTPGPWRFELNEKFRQIQLCGGRVRHDLTVMDFVRWGMNGAAPRFNSEIRPNCNIMKRAEEFGIVCPNREHHADWFKLIRHPDANLIEAAPAYAAAWNLVPHASKDEVFDILKNMNQDWVEASIRRSLVVR